MAFSAYNGLCRLVRASGDIYPCNMVDYEMTTQTEVVRLCKHAGAKMFYIKQPRWHDKRVLLAADRVGAHNLVTFQSKSLEGWFYVSGKVVRKYKPVSNGVIMCRPVPLSDLLAFEPELHCTHEWA